MGVKASVQADAYEWGKAYDIEYVYVYQNVDYKLKGQIAFGAAPAPVNYIVDNAIGYETNVEGRLHSQQGRIRQRSGVRRGYLRSYDRSRNARRRNETLQQSK